MSLGRSAWYTCNGEGFVLAFLGCCLQNACITYNGTAGGCANGDLRLAVLLDNAEDAVIFITATNTPTTTTPTISETSPAGVSPPFSIASPLSSD